MPLRKGMSHPRRVLPGTTYLITRRCIDRRFLLRPDDSLTPAFLYCLGEAADLFHMHVHAYCCMSNHYHLVVTDTRARLPLFMARLNRNLALCIQALRPEHTGLVWEPGRSYRAVELTTKEALLKMTAYTIANPVSARLVEQCADWPGAISTPSQLGSLVRRVDRPARFSNRLPASAELRLVTPASMAHTNHASSWVDAIEELVELREREETLRRSARVLGAKRVLRTPWFSRPPRTQAPRASRRNPSLAAVTWEALRQAASALRAWRHAYRAAWNELKAGLQDVMFPTGTWWLRVHSFVRVDAMSIGA